MPLKATMGTSGPILISIAPGVGAIKQYNTNKGQVQDILGNLREQKINGLGISIFLNKPGDPTYQQTQGVALDWVNGQLFDQDAENLSDFIGEVDKAGFSDALLAFEYFNRENDYWEGISPDVVWGQNHRLEAYVVRPMFYGKTTRPLFDLATEALEATNQNCIQYCKYKWQFWTQELCPGAESNKFGAPCWDASISFVPKKANLDIARDVFRGTSQDNPPNLPRTMIGHFYKDTADWGGLYKSIVGVWNYMYDIGIDSDLTVGEGYTYDPAIAGDQEQADEVLQAVLDVGVNMRGFYAWPVSLRTVFGTSVDPKCIPPRQMTCLQRAGIV